jgi:hypothetical protein
MVGFPDMHFSPFCLFPRVLMVPLPTWSRAQKDHPFMCYCMRTLFFLKIWTNIAKHGLLPTFLARSHLALP